MIEAALSRILTPWDKRGDSMKKLLALITGVAVLLGGSAAFAKKPKPTPPENLFQKLDSNGDSKLSLAEFSAAEKDATKAAEKFKKLDKNGNGFLNLEEYTAGVETKKDKKDKKNV